MRAVEPLVDKLSDPILLVRQAAARALEAMAWAPSTPSEQLNWMLVTQQWDGLAKTGIPAIDPLIAALRDVSDSDERRKVVEALAEIDSQTQAFTAIGLRIRQGPVAPGFVARLFGLNRTSVVRETQVQAVREMVHFLVAKRDGSSLKRIWTVTKEVLLLDAQSSDYLIIQTALHAFIGIGNDAALLELIGALDQSGTKTMAEAYLNCGHKELRTAAEQWAKMEGYTLHMDEGAHPVSWGGWH